MPWATPAATAVANGRMCLQAFSHLVSIGEVTEVAAFLRPLTFPSRVHRTSLPVLRRGRGERARATRPQGPHPPRGKGFL
jgi:hypothetical protein